jgi:hypothetical protein
MDPVANAQETREINARIRAKRAEPGDYGRLRELREAKREWIARGGWWPASERSAVKRA